MTNLKTRLPEILSYQGRNRGVRVENIRFSVPTSLVNPDLEQEAVEKGTSYAIPVKADISFTDANGNPRKQETKTLFRLPFPTAKGGFIIDGSVVQTRNQLRLSPGIYVTRQADGIQAFINSKSRQNIKINYSPETMKMRFNIGGRSFPAYSVLRILGVPDDQMRKTWGDQIFRANYRSTTTDNETVHRLYETMLRYTGTARNSAEKQQQIQEAFASTELDPWVSGVTLGKNYKTADRHAILESTRKILDVGSGKVKPDNRDDLYFQDIYGFNDLLLYGVESQAKKIRNKLAYRVDNQQYSEDDIMARPLSEIRKLMSSKFVQADVVYNPDQVNPIGMMSDSSEVTQMGEGGVGSTYSITEGMRDLQDSSMGFLDPVFTPTSDRVGVNMHMAAGARKVGRDMKVALLDFTRGKQGSAVAMGPRDVYDKYVAIPGEYSPREGGTYLPNKTKVRAMHKGEIVEVPYSKVDYVFMSPHHTFDWATLLIPFLPNNTPTRSTMSVKQSTHALMLAEPETPLVQAGIYRGADGQMTTAEQEFAKKFSRRVPSYMGDSEVVKVTDKSITLRDIKTGDTEEVKLYNDYLLNGSNVLSEIPSVAKGDVVKKGQTIATSNFAKDGKLAMGRNLRIAYMPWHGWNFMDGLVISEDAALKMRAVHVDQIDTSSRKHDRFSKGKFVALYPREYKATQLENLDDEGVIQVGAKVNPGDPLILKLTPRRLTQEDVLAGNVSQAMKQQLTRDDKVWESETPGVVQKVIRTPQGIKVIVRSERPVKVGDKLCLSDDHEYLTHSGWIPVSDLTVNDWVCTLNQDTGIVEYQHPEAVFAYRHTGKMYGIRSQQIDLLTTLNHNMLVKTRGAKSFALHQAQDIMGRRVQYKKDGTWIGKEASEFCLLTVDGRHHGFSPHGLPEVAMDDWLEFLGYYIADGHFSKDGYYVTISKNKTTKNSYGGYVYPKITACLDRMKWPYNPREDKIIISSRQLNEYLSVLGHANDKHVPREFMELSQRQMNILLDALLSCDGSSFSCVSYSTTSKRLADDVQEIALKAGMAANVTPCLRDGNEAHADRYRVSVIRKKTEPMVNHGHTKSQHVQEEKLVDYDGLVYCCTVPNHVMYVRRNGKACWTGNSNRHQAKGVVAAIVSSEEMPHTKEGISFDILQNPAAVPSRINAGQILETAAAKIAAHTGKPYITELFELKGMAKDNPAAIMKKLKEYGLSDQEPLYDSKGNPIMDGSRHVQVLGGFQYFTRQKQEAEPYFNARNRNDPYDIVSLRPIKGPKMGGLGFYALLAHGATKNLQEIATVKSEKNDDFWRAVEEGQNIPTPQMTFAFKKLQALLKGASIDVRQQGDDYRVMPLTDAEVLNMSAGEIPNPAMATRIGRPGKYEMLQSYEGGLYDEKLLGGLQGDRWGHISLVEPLPNPIYEKAIRGILGLAQGEYDGLIEGKLGYLNGKVIQRERNDGSLTGGNAFRQMLSSINVDDEVRRLREEVVTQKGTAKDAMIKKLRYLGALQQMGIKPEEAYIVSKVPVLPPQFRPVYLTKDNEIRVSDFTALYQDIGSMATTMKEGQQSLPESMRNELRANTYDALKALQISSTGTGYGARPRTGILEYLKGQSASWGHFQDKIFDKRQSVGGRMVIRPNPGLSVDQVGIPEDTAWKMYHSFVMRRLTKDGMLPLDARKMVEDREPLAEAALQAEMKARPVLITRDPKLHKFNFMAVYPIMVPGKSMELSPLIAKGFNADFDGDALNITVPVTEGAVREAREKMLPSKNLFKPGKDQVIMRPEEDTIAGLYYGTRFVDPKPDKFYETEREILEAYQSRELALTDGVMLGAGKSAVMVTPGRIMVNRALPEEFKVGIDVILDNAKIGQILNKVGKEAPGKYVDTLRKLADLGNEFNTRAGLSFSLMDFMPVSREELKVMPASGGQLTKSQIEAIDGRMKQSINSRSALAVLADSGAKGSWDKVRQMIYSPVTISGFEGPIPHVVQSGYADGLDFMDYWVAAKGNRPALYTSSIEVRDPGYFSKQLLRSTLGSVITPGDEAPEEGIQFPINHPTVLYRYLAADLISPKGVTVAQAGDAITEDVLASAQAQGVTTVSVRSPLTSKAKMGYYAKDFGRLPGGEKPRVGADIGVISSHTLTEPAVQLSLRAFHGGGAAMSANQVEGLHAIWPLLNGRAPAAVKATMAPVSGKVKSVSKMRGGGYSIAMEDGSEFNTSTNASLMVHPGQTIELGAQINEGLMDPNEILKYRGLRAMQNYLVDQIEKNYGSNAPDRRYIETVVASLTRYGKVLNPGGHQDLMTGDVKDIRELEAINRDSDEQIPVEFEPVFDGMDYDLSKNEKDWGVKMLGRDMIRQLQESASMGLLSPFKSTKPVMPFLRGIDFGETLQETGLY
jgi:DNA-directed RNA polymerase subunit beta'